LRPLSSAERVGEQSAVPNALDEARIIEQDDKDISRVGGCLNLAATRVGRLI